MAGQTIQFHVVTQQLEGGLALAEPLLLDGVAICHEEAQQAGNELHHLLEEAAKRVMPMDWHRTVLSGTPTIGQLHIDLQPPKNQVAWSEPLDLTVRYVRWSNGSDATVAYFPAVDIHIVVHDEADFDKISRNQVLAALQRSKAGESLYRIAQLRRSGELSLSSMEVTTELLSPRQRKALADAELQQKKPLLISQIGRVMSAEVMDPAYELNDIVDRLADALGGRSPICVLLVGPAGVGKSAAFREMVRRRSELELASAVVWATSGARLVAGQTGFGMWQERSIQLCREAAKHQAIVHVGNLVELLSVGLSEHNSQGIATFLKPFMARGELLAVAECTPEQLTVVERQDPSLLDVFRVIRLEEPDVLRGRRILAACAAAMSREIISITEPAMSAIDRLHRRYAGYSAFPARPIDFVRNLIEKRFADYARSGLPPEQRVIDVADVTTAFAKQTGLPAFLLDDSLPFDRQSAAVKFGARVIGQPEAVDLVADLIATVKAGLNRPRRPIASLMFIGPTGVGKTEMAKTLAEYFFGSTDRMARFDMSEFGTPYDIQRLVGGVFGSEGLLTARVREEPFSVVLLDEIEKAHPLLFDLLLQMLGEGRLTDAAGRVADFSNAIVVMTSNLGAEQFQQGSFGLRQSGEPDAKKHFTEAVRDFLRPEMFNRIDRIVPFLPLSGETVRHIVQRELDQVARRDGIFLRRVLFAPTDEVVQWLANNGYDRAYGARPLKRLMERELLVPLADGINNYTEDQRLRADVAIVSNRLSVVVKALPQTASTYADTLMQQGWAESAQQAGLLRRVLQRLDRSTALLAARNELVSLQEHQRRAEAEAKRKKEAVRFDAVRALRTARLETANQRVAATLQALIELEELCLVAVYDRKGPESGESPESTARRLRAMSADCADLLLTVYGLRYDEPHTATIGIYGTRQHERAELANAYVQLAKAMRPVDSPPFALRAWWYKRDKVKYKDDKGKEQEDEVLLPQRPPSSTAMLANPPKEAEGLLLSIEAPHVQALLSAESGAHLFRVYDKEDRCLVEVSELPPSKYPPSSRALLRESFEDVPIRRIYQMDRSVGKDARMARELRWGAAGIYDAIEAGYRYAVQSLYAEVLTEPDAMDGAALEELPF